MVNNSSEFYRPPKCKQSVDTIFTTTLCVSEVIDYRDCRRWRRVGTPLSPSIAQPSFSTLLNYTSRATNPRGVGKIRIVWRQTLFQRLCRDRLWLRRCGKEGRRDPGRHLFHKASWYLKRTNGRVLGEKRITTCLLRGYWKGRVQMERYVPKLVPCLFLLALGAQPRDVDRYLVGGS